MERRLTEAVIPALRTTKPTEEVYHSGTPSAGIRVSREGAKTFFIRYRSPILTGKDSDKPLLRRYLFGEHRSGRPGEGRYLTLKEFETAYAVFRGQLAQGIDPQPAPAAAMARARENPLLTFFVAEAPDPNTKRMPLAERAELKGAA